jgi:superfamily II DNA/RNA helicase
VVEFFQEHGSVLVRTDVLGKEQNLQNAQFLVNYDFRWNPVVLIQRAGSIDRMRSKHKRVYLIDMMQENSDPDNPR